jgi:putative transposase
MAFTPYNPDEPVHVHRQKLPHWRQWKRTYFVTSRLADSVPKALADAWRFARDAWLHAHGIKNVMALDALSEEDRHEYHREFTAKFHELLDAGHGTCELARSDCADVLVEKLLDGNGSDYDLDTWCIMPNHFHVLVEPLGSNSLGSIVKKWKGGSAIKINHLVGKRGSLWQAEPFDRIVRSQAQLEHFRRYIASNPVKANLKNGFVVGIGAQSR